MKGLIKNIIAKRHFGFVRADNGGDYFFHRDDFNGHWDDLEADAMHGNVEVTFDVVESTKGLRAGNVRRLDFPNQT